MRAMIVDDEPLARRELRRLLAEFAWIDIVGEAANVREAAPLIDRLLPELLFLDIQMPGGTGFDLLERLEHLPRVVFTTAYDKHAVRAFEVNALDYLLKPIEPERLAAAVVRAQAAAASTPAAAATSGINSGKAMTVRSSMATREESRSATASASARLRLGTMVPAAYIRLLVIAWKKCGSANRRV